MSERDNGLHGCCGPQQGGSGPLGQGAAAHGKARDGGDRHRPGGQGRGPDGAAGFVAPGEPDPVGGVGKRVGVVAERAGRALTTGDAAVGEVKGRWPATGRAAAPAGEGGEVGAEQGEQVGASEAGAAFEQAQVCDGESPAGTHPAASRASAGRQGVHQKAQGRELGQCRGAVCGPVHGPAGGMPEEAGHGRRGETPCVQAGQQGVGGCAAVGDAGYGLHAPCPLSTGSDRLAAHRRRQGRSLKVSALTVARRRPP